MDDTTEAEHDYKEERKRLNQVRKNFFIYGLGISLTLATTFAVVNLQSSINIKEGLGTIAIGLSYAFSVLCCLLLTPIVVRRLGVKKTVIISDVAYLVFVLANAWAEFYTLIPAAIIVGMGCAGIWITIGMYNVHYAQEYCKVKNKSSDEGNVYINMFSGCFFTMYQSFQVFGNLISYFVLYGLNKPAGNFNLTHSYNKTLAPNETSYENCGANDCQDPETVDREVHQYIPANPVTVHVLIGIFVAMDCVAIALHCVFLPDVKLNPDTKKIDRNDSSQISYKTFGDEGDEYENVYCYTKEGLCEIISTTLKDMFRHLIRRKQLLIIPLTIYNGMLLSFLYSEVTRAFSSCVLGVAMIGIHMAIFGTVDAIVSGVVGKCKTNSSRSVFFATAATLDLCSYLYCLLWEPESWSIYLLYVAIGFSDGIWQPLINVMHLEYFPENHDIALASWNLSLILGMSIGFGWSTFLCVSTKIYVQITVLSIGLVGYGFAEFIHWRE